MAGDIPTPATEIPVAIPPYNDASHCSKIGNG